MCMKLVVISWSSLTFCGCSLCTAAFCVPCVRLGPPPPPNLHNAWPRLPSHFQDPSQTPSRRNRAYIRAAADPDPSTYPSPSPYPSVASSISHWEQRFTGDSGDSGDSQPWHPATPQHTSQTPGTNSVGRRRGQRWAPPTTPTVYGLDLEAGKKVCVSRGGC